MRWRPGRAAAPRAGEAGAGITAIKKVGQDDADTARTGVDLEPRHVRVGLGMVIALALWVLLILAGYLIARILS